MEKDYNKKWLKFFSQDQLKELDSYPNLKEAIDASFIKHKWDKTKLSPLTIWYRLMSEEKDCDLVYALDWNEETEEEFYSWGTNSRWLCVFEQEMFSDQNSYAETALNLAKEYGDLSHSVLNI